jgi:hypothetical protein
VERLTQDGWLPVQHQRPRTDIGHAAHPSDPTVARGDSLEQLFEPVPLTPQGWSEHSVLSREDVARLAAGLLLRQHAEHWNSISASH